MAIRLEATILRPRGPGVRGESRMRRVSSEDSPLVGGPGGELLLLGPCSAHLGRCLLLQEGSGVAGPIVVWDSVARERELGHLRGVEFSQMVPTHAQRAGFGRMGRFLSAVLKAICPRGRCTSCDPGAKRLMVVWLANK